MPVGGRRIHEGSWLTTVASTGKWYLIASMLSRGLGIFLLPLYTTYLTTADYGLLSTIESIALLLPLVISLSLESAIGRFYHDYHDDKEGMSLLFSTIFWFVAVVGALGIGLTLVSSIFWAQDVLTVPPFPLLIIAFVPVLFVQLGKLGISFLQQSLEAKTVGVIQVLSSLLKFATVFPLLAIFALGVKGVLLATAVAAMSTFLLITYHMVKYEVLTFSFDRTVLREALIYSIPLVPGLATTWVNSISDRIIIAKYDSLEGAGLYAFAFQIGLILYFVGDAISRVIAPLAISGLKHDQEATTKNIVGVSLQLLSLMSVLAVGGMLFSRELTILLGSEAYHQSAAIMPLILLPKIWSLQYRFFVNVISFHKVTWYLTLASILSATVNLIINLMFVEDYGYVIGPISTMVSSLVYFSVLYVCSERLMHVPYQKGRSLLLFALCVLTCVIAQYFDEFGAALSLSLLMVLKIAIFIIAIVFIVHVGKVDLLSLKRRIH